MKTYNYKRAFKEVIEPAFCDLSTAVLAAVQKVSIECENVGQDSDLNIPLTESLIAAFIGIEDAELSIAASIVHAYGHNAPTPLPIQKSGAYWKFSNLADQILRKRLGIPGRESRGYGISYCILEGAIRICCDTHYGWTWKEVCVATPENLAVCKRVCPRISLTEKQYKKQKELFQSFERRVGRVIEALGDTRFGGNEYLAHTVDSDEFLEFEEKDKEYELQELFNENKIVSLKAVTSRQFDPHPYCITPKHIEHSNGILGSYSIESAEKFHDAKCGVRGCTLPYSEHKAKNVAVLVLRRDVSQAEVKEELKRAVPVLEKIKLDGVVFEKSKFNFTD